jgi:tRNA (cmo5U34)-methyltransferase
MNEFDSKAREWDLNPMHWERSEAVASALKEMVPLSKEMKALEFGAGTGILSFLLHPCLSEIVLMDHSQEMVKVMHEKVAKSKAKNLKPLLIDLEHQEYVSQKFDLIFNQMVLHHVNDIDGIFDKFYTLLHPGGYLAIADLYAENGSFHGEGFTGHNGFDVEQLAKTLKKHLFTNILEKQCFFIKREIANGEIKEFPVFLMVAKKSSQQGNLKTKVRRT